MKKEDADTWNANIEGICFRDMKGSEINDFSSVINHDGMFMSLLDEHGNFKGVVLLNPGETKEILSHCNNGNSGKRLVIFGLMNRYDREGNLHAEYFTGTIEEEQTVIITRRGKDLKKLRVFINTGRTEKIMVKMN